MSAALRLREDYGAPELRALARAARDADQTRRLLARAAIYEGAWRGAAAEIGGVQRQTGRDWGAAFNGHGPSGLIDGKAPGQRPLVNPEQRQVLKRIVEAGPDPAVDGVVRWRLIDPGLRRGRLWHSGSLPSSVSRSASRHSAGCCARWAIANSRPGHAIMPRTPPRRRFSKSLCRPLGRDRPRRCGRPADRGVVCRRGPHRAEEQDHTALGAAGHPACSAARSAHRFGLHLRRDLSQAG